MQEKWIDNITLQIGSSPGFEDGEFESAKLLHPAASFYHAAEDCLYIVDSEVIIHNGLPLFTQFDMSFSLATEISYK